MAKKPAAAPLTLWQFCALRGFRRQTDLLAAIEAGGGKVPQANLSRMVTRGDPAYPRARALLAQVLQIEESHLNELLANTQADHLARLRKEEPTT